MQSFKKPAKEAFLKMIVDTVKQIAVDGKGTANWASQKKADSRSKYCFQLFLPKCYAQVKYAVLAGHARHNSNSCTMANKSLYSLNLVLEW
jgi:hypothetical protein